METKGKEALQLARKKIEKNRNFLVEKNAELADINCRLDDVQKQIKDLKSFNTDDVQLESMRHTDNLRIQFENEQVKFDFFKQVNILNNNFELSGRIFSSNNPMDNLVRCLIDISDSKAFLPKAYLYEPFTDSLSRDEKIDKFIQNLKNFVYIEENSSEITQSKVDEISNNIGQMKQMQMPTCILFDHKNKAVINSTTNEKTIFLYRHGDNFLVLQVNTDTVSVVSRVHNIVNNLICEPVLYELCKKMLRVKCGTSIDTCSMEILYQTFKIFKKDFVENKDEMQKRFLSEINVAKSENAIESLIESQVTLLLEQRDQVNEYSDEDESIKQDIDLLKDKFVERVQLVLFDEYEKRKKMAQAKLKMDTSENDSIENEIAVRQKEIDKLNSLLSKKNDQLSEKNKEIDLKREQMKLLIDSNDKQEKEINAEIEQLRQELIVKEQEIKTIEVNECNSEKSRAEKLRSDIQNKQTRIDELNRTKNALEKKREELSNSIETAIREKACLEKENMECHDKRNYLEQEINDLNNQSTKLYKLIQFVQTIYSQLLTSESLFRKRAELNRVLHSDSSFLDLYTYLIDQDELKQFKDPIVEQIAKQNVYKRRELLVNCLDKILAEPVLNTYRDNTSGHMVIELNAININYEEIEPLINRHLEQEINKSELFALDSTKRVLITKDNNLKMKHLLDNNKSADHFSDELIINLIHKCMIRKFLIKNQTCLKKTNGHLTSGTKVKLSVKDKKFDTLGELNAQHVLQMIELNFESIKKCYVKTIKIVAGHNVFIEKKELRVCGINMAIVAGNDVVLPFGALLDTSGSSEPFNYENDEAHGYAGTSKEDKCCEGEPGVDGFDGFSGENAGHIYIKATNLIQNLDQIDEIRINGGKGGNGQMGGFGQDGGPGQDTGDAEAEQFSACLFSPSFVVAFARLPGLDPETGEFSRIGELSGKGGDAGKTGLGGMGGHAGQLLIKDSTSWIENKRDNKEIIESSDNLKNLIRKLTLNKKILSSHGTAGQNGNYLSVKGGKAGKAGTYGKDHVIYVDGLFSSRTDQKGDYSNYLLEKPLVENGSLDFDETKYAAKSIIEDPDAYATRSKSYTVFSGALTAGAVIGAGFLLAPIITAAMAVVPVIGFAAWATGLALAGSAILGSIAGLTGAAMVFTKKTFSGLDYKIGVKKEMKMKNRQQIMFNNRYCCVPPLRDNTSCSQNLRRSDKRSEKEKGMDSCLREESEREEQSRANETPNEFANAYERAAMSDKANSIRTDSTKDEEIKLANEELKQMNAQIEQCESSMQTLVDQISQLTDRINQCEMNISEHQRQVSQIDQQINCIGEMLSNEQSQMSQVHQEMLQSVDLYLNSIDKQVSARIQLQLSSIDLNSKAELVKNLNQAFSGLKEALNTEAQQLVDQKLNLQNQIELAVKQKEQREQEIEAFRAKELNAIKSQMNTERELAELDELHKKLKNEQQTRTDNVVSDEIMVMKEFKRDNDNKKSMPDDGQFSFNIDFDKIKFSKRQIDIKVYASIFSSKDYPKFYDLVTSITQKTKKDRNTVIGKIEFLINAYSSGLYQKLNQDNKEVSKMEKLKGLVKKDPIKELNCLKVFEEMKKNPFSLDILYEKIVTLYFKNIPLVQQSNTPDINQDTYLKHASLNLHYESTKNDCLTQLEHDLFVFVTRIYAQKINKEKLMRIIKLVKVYKEQIDEIASYKFSALVVIESAINYFYESIIMFINYSLDNNSCESIWLLLDDLLNLIELLRVQLDQINKTSLWSEWNLVKNQIYLLDNLLKNTEYVKAKKNEIDQWIQNDQNKFGIFKIQLIIGCLQPKLIDVLVGKCDSREFDTLRNDLIKASICTSQEKDEYLVMCKLKNCVAKHNCVSQQGFITKYRLLLSIRHEDNFDFVKIIEHAENIYINSEKLKETISIMFKEYVYLLNEDKSLSFDNLKLIYFKLAKLKNPNLIQMDSIVKVFAQLEMNLSQRIEEIILKSIDKDLVQSELEDQLNVVLNQRIVDIDGNYSEIMLRKVAFYTQLFNLVNKIDNDKIKIITIILTYSNGSLGAGECLELDSASREFLKKYECHTNDPRNAFEQIIFKLSHYQCEMMLTSLSLNDQDIDQRTQKKLLENQLKELISQFNKLCKEILSVKSNGQMMQALKKYANKFEDNKLNQERKKQLLKCCSIGNEANFLKELYKLHKNLATNDLLKLIDDVVKSSLKEQFLVNCFLLDVVCFYKSSSKKTNNRQDYLYKLIDLIDIEPSLNANNYNELLDYLDKLRIIPNKYNKRLIERIKFKLKSLTNDLVELSYNMCNTSNVDKNVKFALSVLVDLSQNIDLMSKDNINYLNSFYKLINNYKIQLNELVNARSNDQIMLEKLCLQFIDNINMVFTDYLKKKIDQQQHQNYFPKWQQEKNFEKILEVIQTISDKSTLSQFIHFLNIRLNINIETTMIKCLDRTFIETELINWSTSEQKNSFLIEQSLRLVTQSYMTELMQKTTSIKSQLDDKEQELNKLLTNVVDIYKSKLDTENKLIVKARVNFLLELIKKLNASSVQNWQVILNDLKSQADNKESASEIELYLIEKVNLFSLENIDNELKEHLNLNEQSTVDQVFMSLFGDIGESKLSHFKNLIKLTSSKNQYSMPNTLRSSIQQITRIVENFYFIQDQNQMDKLTKDWINKINKYIYSNSNRDKNLIELKSQLYCLMRAKCFKVNNYSAFIDRPQFTIKLIDLTQEFKTILDQCQVLFDDICISQMNKISHYYQLISSKLEQIEQKLITLDEFEFKNILNNLLSFELDNQLVNISSQRDLVLKLISQNVDQRVTSEQVKLLDRKRLNEFSLKFEKDLCKSVCDDSSIISRKLHYIYNYVGNKQNEQTFKAYIYLNYRNFFGKNKFTAKLTIDYLNQIGEFVLNDWYSLSIQSNYVNLQLATKDYNCLDMNDFGLKLNYYLIYLSSNLDKNNLIKFCEYLCSNIELANSVECLTMLIKCLVNGLAYEKTAGPLVNRIAEKLTESIGDEDDHTHVANVFKFLIDLNQIDKHNCSYIVVNFVQKFGIELFKKFCLNQTESKLFTSIHTNYTADDCVSLLSEADVSIWQNVLYDNFVGYFCEYVLEKPHKSILNNNLNNKKLIQDLNLLVHSSCVNKCTQSYQNSKMQLIESQFDLLELDQIKKFKDNVFNCVHLITEFDLVEFFDSIRTKHNKKLIDLNICTDILYFGSMIGRGIDELTSAINSDKPSLHKRVLILTIGHLLIKIFNIEEKEKKANLIMAHIYKHVPNGNERLLHIIAEKIKSNLQSGLRYESSEVETLNDNLSLMLKVVFYEPKCIEQLSELPILKWSSILRAELIKFELNTDDAQIVSDLRKIEKLCGLEITKRFIEIVKSVKIEDLLLKFLVTKFRKNEWDLNDNVLNLIEKNKNTSEWISMIKKFDSESKSKVLRRAELIDEMKRLEANGEINSYVRKLIERNENGKCLIENCLDQLDKVFKNGSNLFANLSKKKINEYEKSDIAEWTKMYKKEKKNNLESINCVHLLELVAVLCRSVKLVHKYEPRDVQKIALLLFIDSIVFNFSGRLANISTGEGKSLITITTTIAYILIKGGNVDILTSSEILAERDAIESRELFCYFDITVTNNCDSMASADENVRKQRYSNNMVVYGDIGSFQRDILLSKYFDKEIRSDLAGCLIIDEVDSMCIDNICNTLYISHQIADLTYLKDFYCHIWQAVDNKDTCEYTQENVLKVKEYIEHLTNSGHLNYPCNLEDFVNRRLDVWINNAYVAKHYVEEGNHYSVLAMGKKCGQAVINDLQTGVEQLNTQWSDGLQQFIQLKHLNKLGEESLKAIFMSNYVFFTQYKGNIYGMTGTLGANIERDLLAKAYDLDFFQVPRFKKELNVKQDDILVATKSEWLEQIENDVDLHVAHNRTVSIDEQKQAQANMAKVQKQINDLLVKIDQQNKLDDNVSRQVDLFALNEDLKTKQLELQDLNDTSNANNGQMMQVDEFRNSGGRCVLIICENKNHVHDIVRKLFYKHKHLYEYTGKVEGLCKVVNFNKRERVQIEQLRPGDIVVATNVAGRGTDFKISRLAERNGGLHVIVSYLPDNIRVEMQAFGRSGRKGDQGSGRLIVYDCRVANLSVHNKLSIDTLKEERDLNEEKRLHTIRVEMIAQVMLERHLFLRFDSLYENKVKPILKLTKTEYRHLQIKSLHNHWAFWLDKMSPTIKSLNTTNEQQLKKEALDQLEIFANEIESKMNRNTNGIEGLIDEPGELIKLAKYNIQEGNFNSAILNCNHINTNFAPSLTPYSHYYKAIALFEPIKQSSFAKTINNIFGQSEKKYTHEQIENGIKLLKKSAHLFELEIERLKAQSIIMADIEQNKPIIGTHNDHLTKSNTNESTAIMVHLLATKFALGLDLNLDELKLIFKHTMLGEDKMNELFELALANEAVQPFVKKKRFSKNVQIKIHVERTPKSEALFANIGHKCSHSELILDNLLQADVKFRLVEENIKFSYEFYVYDRISECMKILHLPNRFKPFKKLLIKHLCGDQSLGSKKAAHRAEMYDLFKHKLIVYCSQRNKIQNFLATNFGNPAVQTNNNNNNNNHNQTDGKLLLNSIKKNCQSKEEFFGRSKIDHFVQHLSQSKFTFKPQSTPLITTLFQFKNRIYLNNSLTRETLAQKLNLSLFNNSPLLRQKVLTLLVKNDRVTSMEQVCESIMPLELNTNLLRNNLINNGLAKSFFDQLGFTLVNKNNEQIIKCNESIGRLFEPKVNPKQKLEFNCDDFLNYLQAIGIVKNQRLALSNNVKRSNLKMIIEECIGDKVIELVDKSIEQGLINKRQYLVFNNRDKEVIKFKSFVSQALLSCLSPLKTSNECHIAYNDLVDSFKGMNLPREVDQYTQLNKNMVFSFSTLSVPVSCSMYNVALQGSVQAKIGNFLIGRQSLSQSCLSKSKLASVEQIVNDVAYVIQSGEDISLASLSLCAKVTTVLAASVIGINSFNQQRAKESNHGQIVQKAYSHQVQHALKQMQSSSTQINTGSWLTNTIFEHIFKSIIFYIESNHEYKTRSTSLSKNLLHSGAKTRAQIDYLLRQKFTELQVEFNDRISMKMVHLVNQLVGPLAIQLNDSNFENISLHVPTVIEIVNIVNDMIFDLDKEIRVRLVEEKAQIDSEEELQVVLNNLVVESVSAKLFDVVFCDNFNKFLNHVLKSVGKKSQEIYLDKLNELKNVSSALDQTLAKDLFQHKLQQAKTHIDKYMHEIKHLQNSIFSI